MGQGHILNESALDQANAERVGSPGSPSLNGTTGVRMQPGWKIKADQLVRGLQVATLQQIDQVRRKRPPLTKTEQGIDPEGWIIRFRR